PPAPEAPVPPVLVGAASGDSLGSLGGLDELCGEVDDCEGLAVGCPPSEGSGALLLGEAPVGTEVGLLLESLGAPTGPIASPFAPSSLALSSEQPKATMRARSPAI